MTQSSQQTLKAISEELKQLKRRLELEVQVREKVEQKLTQAQLYLNSMINSMPSALITIDENLLVTQWNNEAARLSGIDQPAALGRPLEEVFPYLIEQLPLIVKALAEQSMTAVQGLKLVKHGTLRLDLLVYPLLHTQKPSAVIRIDDHTEMYQLQNAMIKTEKMMSLGGLAAGMAHEINNPLGAIVQNAQNIKRRLDPQLLKNQQVANELGVDLQQMQQYHNDRGINRFLANITDAGLRASSIIHNMLQFSRDTEPKMSQEHIGALLENALKIAQNDYSLRASLVTIEQHLAMPDIAIRCVKTEIEQVMVNLLKNAAQSIQERIQTSNDFAQGVIVIEQTTDSDNCIIKISDTGMGMDERTQQKLFEPFFTTKVVGSGTGLGLSISYFIVKEHHGGSLEVCSKLGQGSCFTLKLPLSTKRSH